MQLRNMVNINTDAMDSQQCRKCEINFTLLIALPKKIKN